MNPNDTVRLRAFWDPSVAGTALLAFVERDGKRFAVKLAEAELQEIARGTSSTCYQGTRLLLEDHAAQELVDSLWDAGLRPRAAKGSAGQLEAVQAHLVDTRKLLDEVLHGAVRLEHPALAGVQKRLAEVERERGQLLQDLESCRFEIAELQRQARGDS